MNFINLKVLNLNSNININDKSLENLFNLNELYLNKNENITDDVNIKIGIVRIKKIKNIAYEIK